MSLFVATLAFDEATLSMAKIGILTASLVAGMAGSLVLAGCPPRAEAN